MALCAGMGDDGSCPECKGGMRLSRNPSDGVDTSEEYAPEWGVWRKRYYDEGGEQG